jgi:hypothetical protein
MTFIFVTKDLKIIPIKRLMYSDHSHDLFTILTRTARQVDHVAHLGTGETHKILSLLLHRAF